MRSVLLSQWGEKGCVRLIHFSGVGPPPARGGRPRSPAPQILVRGLSCDARAGMPQGMPWGAMCVQRFDDSLNSAIHITYRISLRSSSMPEPRDPLLKVLTYFIVLQRTGFRRVYGVLSAGWTEVPPWDGLPRQQEQQRTQWFGVLQLSNDPSAGSPTETLLRLLLPLND